MIITDVSNYISSWEIHRIFKKGVEMWDITSIESELNDAKEEIRNLKALLNQNSQNSNKPPSTDSFVKKKTQKDKKRVIDFVEVKKDILALH